MKKLTTTDFIAKAQAVHGVGTYDYSRVVYSGNKAKIVIFCPSHGAFEQQAGSHLQGCGCKSCMALGRKTFTTAEFIAKAQEVHGVGRYDYSQTVYTKALEHLSINCPQHGQFSQTAASHTSGVGCPKCGREKCDIARTRTQLNFLAAAQAAHGSKYDYSKTAYRGGKKTVEIGCPTHGIFEQVASEHIAGKGCLKCSHDLARGRYQMGLDEFIARAREAHGAEAYDYSKVLYVNSKSVITITCPVHGDFSQAPGGHLAGKGCTQCANRGKRAHWVQQVSGRECSLYFVRIFDQSESFCKVGVTASEVAQRFRELKNSGYSYEVLALHKSVNAARVWEWEQSILETFAPFCYRPRNSFDGCTECFSSEAVNEILEIFPI